MATLRRSLWIGAVAFGLALLVVGVFFIKTALDARAEIRAGLLEEQITTSKDAPIPGVLVQDAATAEAQAEAIKEHTLGKMGPYSKIPSKLESGAPNPDRQTYINGVTLRTALYLAAMGFGVAELALGAGAVFLMLGVATITVLAPVTYWVGRVEPAAQRVPLRAPQLSPAGAGDD